MPTKQSLKKIDKIWINGRFLELGKAKISVFDRGFMYGDGAFETMRSYAGVIFKLDAHLNRLFRSLIILRIKPPYVKEYLKGAVYDTLKANLLLNRHCGGAYIKITITRGEGRFGISYKDTFSPNVVIVAKAFDGYPDWMFDRGISACITGIRNERSMLAGIKSLNYLPFVMARFKAKGEGFDDAILTNTKGYITEGATSNIFLVKGNSLIIPSLASGVLPGITRDVIIHIARRLKIPIKEKSVSRKELLSAHEVFFTNSLAEVLPVTRVGSKRIGDGKVGPITKLLRISYQKQVIKAVTRSNLYC